MTDYTQIENTYDQKGYWNHIGKIVVKVDGEVATLVRKRVDAQPDAVVTFVEDHWDSGFCETCSYAETDFLVEVDGKEVYKADRYGDEYAESPQGISTLAEFQRWLEGEEIDE